MKLKMLKQCVAGKKPRKIHEIVDIEEHEAELLISYGDAVEHKDKRGRPKEK